MKRALTALVCLLLVLVAAPSDWRGPGAVGPAGAQAVTGNLPVVGQSGAGFASITPTPNAAPTTSTINFPLSDTRANGVTVPLSAGTMSMVYKSSAGKTTHLILDVTGYFK